MPPFIYSTEQKVWIVKQLLSGHSARTVRKLFAAEFTESQVPSVHTVQMCLEKFNQFGCLNNDHQHIMHKKREPILTEEVQTVICANVEVNPHISSREIAEETGVSKQSVLKVLKDSGYKQSTEFVRTSDGVNGKKRKKRVVTWMGKNSKNFVTKPKKYKPNILKRSNGIKLKKKFTMDNINQ